MISMKRAFGLGVFAVAVLVPVLSSPREAFADDDDDDAAEEAKSPDPAVVDSSCGALLDKATAGIEKPKADAKRVRRASKLQVGLPRREARLRVRLQEQVRSREAAAGVPEVVPGREAIVQGRLP